MTPTDPRDTDRARIREAFRQIATAELEHDQADAEGALGLLDAAFAASPYLDLDAPVPSAAPHEAASGVDPRPRGPLTSGSSEGTVTGAPPIEVGDARLARALYALDRLATAAIHLKLAIPSLHGGVEWQAFLRQLGNLNIELDRAQAIVSAEGVANRPPPPADAQAAVQDIIDTALRGGDLIAAVERSRARGVSVEFMRSSGDGSIDLAARRADS